MSLLAWSYLSVQYLLGLGRSGFIALLAVAAVAEVALLVGIGADLEEVALALMCLQLVCAAVIVTLSFRTRAAPAEAEHGVLADALDLGVAPGELPVEDPHSARAAGAVRLGLRRHRAEPADH
jgi:hypothetical protein